MSSRTGAARPETLRNYERVREAAARGLTRPEISAETGLGYDRVKEIVRALGLAVANARPGARANRYSPPKLPAQRATALVERVCLCGCGQRFQSSHAGERIAPRCRPSWSER